MSAHERDEGSTLAPGYLVAGEYVVDAVSHEGAGWISYKGHHVERADELVSITSLRADAPSAGYIEAFARRSQWLAEASIPNVPPLLASGVEMGLPVIVTPWVDGLTLRELLAEEGSLAREEALRIIKSVGETLDAMHARRPSVVHQLLSLDNIRIDGITRAARVMDAGAAHALRAARVEDIHAAAKVPNVFRAPEDTVGRTPTASVDRYALAKLAEALLSPVAPNTQLARAIQRGASDLAASRFPTCAAFVQALTQALKDSKPFPAPQINTPAKSAVPAPAPSATSSPGAAAIDKAAKPQEPPPSIFGGTSEPPAPPAPPAAIAPPTPVADPPPLLGAMPPVTGPKVAPPALPRPATASPGATAIAQSTKPAGVAPPLPTTAKPAPRATKSTLVGVAPPSGPPKKALTSTLLGMAAPIVTPEPLDPSAAAPAAPLPAAIPPLPPAAPPVIAASADKPASPAAVPSAASSEGNPFVLEPTKTERVEIDPAMRDASLDEEIVVGDNSIIESLSLLPAADSAADAGPTISEVEIDPLPASIDRVEPAPTVVEPPREAKQPAADIGLAQTMVGAAPAFPPMPKSAPAPSSAFDDDPFPAIPPLSESEKQNRPAAAAVEVPPLFEMGPPVPAPISPDATSGMPPVSLEKPRSAAKTAAIAVAVVLGLGGGIAGGVIGFERMMRGENASGSRGVGTPGQPTNSTAQSDAGVMAVLAPDVASAVEPNNGSANAVDNDASTAVGNGSSDDAAATVAMAEDASAAAEDVAVAQNEPEDSGVRVANAVVQQDSGVASSAVAAPNADGVVVVPGEPGQSSPDWRTRGGARRIVRERVEACGENGANRGTARFEVRFDGATGRVIQFNLFNPRWRGTPLGDCIERAMRSVALPTFTDRHWDTDYAVPLR
ncbi:MAG: protein kinase [Myxococcales bacterium]|nr:protein kinase [Myxococcales bacterium]